MTPRVPSARRRAAVLLLALLALAAGSLIAGTATPAAAADAPAGPVTVAADAIKKGATVTVSKTANLGFESVQVSWKGFPTQDAGSRPFRIYQCRANPTSADDCYGSVGGGSTGALSGINGYGPDGAGNRVTVITGKDGTGSSSFVVETSQQISSLGCDSTTPCSLVVWDLGGLDETSSTPWAPHVAIPLTFRPGLEGCSLKDATFAAEGAPAANLAMLSWTAHECLGASKLTVDYSLLGDSQARDDLDKRTVDVALTTRGGISGKIAYAPLAVSGISIGYVLDDPVTGAPITGLRLNARLVAKLITSSYPSAFGAKAAGNGHPGCDPRANLTQPGLAFCPDPGTLDNPPSIFADPEFQQLNAALKVDWSDFSPAVPTSFFQPVLAGDGEDLTYELTRWLTSDPDAKAFLTGTPDPYGMKVNAGFLDAVKAGSFSYPTDAIRTVDPTSAMQLTFFPLAGLDAVVRQATLVAPSGRDPNTINPLDGSISAYTPQRQGIRNLFTVFDSADAANISMASAALENGAGAFVTPTDASMGAAVAAMTKNADGTRQADFAAKDAGAYPLTMVHYAAVPTTGIAKAKAAGIADFVDYVVKQGQTTGQETGQLPAGYLSLPKDLVDEAVAAEVPIRAQLAPPAPKPLETPSGNGLNDLPTAGSDPGVNDIAAGGGSGGDLSTPAPSATPDGTAQAASNTTTPSPTPTGSALSARLAGARESTGVGAWILPILLGVGVAAAVFGPVAVTVSGGRGPAWVRGLLARLPR